ncbi:undecaprenyl-diphosphatase [Bacillus sp. FJAT-47783]|uniref:undecaprenyl-diphosphatase n=1 Tax=Bacillus sp. FJAT-47783 TaxID=2922712 RepID=UPI001FACC695|nr:undecaprenyl-diphosphatase [Bacillus sp. FJAT-47783]
MDTTIFRAINMLSGRFSLLDKWMIFISNKIRYVYILLLLMMWFKNMTYKKMTVNAVISSFITLILNSFIKFFYFKPRPFVKRRVGILIPSKRDSSFPSKHTLLVFAISTSVFLYERVLGFIMFGLSFLTGFSRIWVGHHYPSDIIGSAVLGSLTSMIIHKLIRFQTSFVFKL